MFSSVPALLFICELNDGFVHVVIHYVHQLNAVHDFHLSFIYLEHKIKRILDLLLNWKV